MTTPDEVVPQLPAKLRTRPLGKSGLVVSELALGTWGLSGEGYGPVSNGSVFVQEGFIWSASK